jgi:peptidyl-tRNA hydrolase, PTH1 family
MTTTPQWRVIMGLGNPGKQYSTTRHNIGFVIVDTLAEKYHGHWQSKYDALVCTIAIDGHPLTLVKPQTFMNSSGTVIKHVIKQPHNSAELLVVHDELELPFGTIKFKNGGSHKGHNGLKSIIESYGPDFDRLRFGIGRPADQSEVPEYVLSPFTTAQKPELPAVIDHAIRLIEAQMLQKHP